MRLLAFGSLIGLIAERAYLAEEGGRSNTPLELRFGRSQRLDEGIGIVPTNSQPQSQSSAVQRGCFCSARKSMERLA